MRNRSLAFFVIAFQFQILVACSSDPVSNAQTSDRPRGPSASAEPADDGDEPPAPAPLPTEADRSNVDLTDPVAAATCGEIATRPLGTFTADPAFEVTGTRTVAGMFDAVNRLSLAFDWPTQRVVDGDNAWLYDARRTLALEVIDGANAFVVSPTPVAVRVWKYEKAERACTTVNIGRRDDFSGVAMDGTATVLITKRGDTELEGVVALKDAKGIESKLTFVAPLVTTLDRDTTVCCLGAHGGG